MRTAAKPGDRVGDWTLVSKIDAGGNGDVWRVSNSKGDDKFAIKILRRMEDVRFHRFRNEIITIKSLSGVVGVVPIIDYNIPANSGLSPPWYVMPLAIPMHIYISTIDYKSVARSFVLISRTIAHLHSLNIAHRDIKPENILFINDVPHISDFGLSKTPDSDALTKTIEDVGAKFTMAPEMRRDAVHADYRAADVYSLAKSLWIALTRSKLGFDGEYQRDSAIALTHYLKDLYLGLLDHLLEESTDHDPTRRPSAENFANRLEEWLAVSADFHRRNNLEWQDTIQSLFGISCPERASWTGNDAISKVLNFLGHATGLNHMFYPGGGGNTITASLLAGESSLIEIEALGTALLRPLQLTFYNIDPDHYLSFFWLEAGRIKPTGIYERDETDFSEHLTEIFPGQYEERNVWEYAGFDPEAEPLPKTARPVTRYLRGSFVIFSTRSPYNLDAGTYDARHQAMGEAKFVYYIKQCCQQIDLSNYTGRRAESISLPSPFDIFPSDTH